MRAFVQEVEPSEPIYVGLFQAAHWFAQRGYEVIRFDFAAIDSGLLDDDLLNRPDEMVVRGGVGTIRRILQRAGRPAPPNFDLPESLQSRIARRHWPSTLGEVRRLVNSEGFQPLHVKPLLEHKLFKGTVVRAFRDLIATAHIPAETPVLVQEYVEFVSEWRAAILNDRVLNIAHYLGDPLLFPDPQVVRDAVTEFEGRPVAFCMDWGVTSAGQTLLVEINDGYSFGNYGLRGPEFTAMIEARWRELMGL
jgi:hypothetical protein